ncbi:OmpA family protein [uncultured Pelagimonas sp.]|uniref:OmpA family protein n=1 Tax=uncultured Pelagimonas sp. TaxID=1618102 RepID=UPI00260749E4|nr:OmpA family protein [uncultured Pelagimonas sp.]
MRTTKTILPMVLALAFAGLPPAQADTAAENSAIISGPSVERSHADNVTAIIKSLAPIAGQSTGPVIQPLPDVFLPPVVIERPVQIIIDRRPIILDYRYSLDMTVYFAYDSAFLTPPARQYLALLGEALQAPEMAGHRYLIAGHTDARGPHDYNMDLSYRRAWAVKRFLMRHYAIASWRLEVAGWGEMYPRDPSDPYDASNRRVEFTLIDVTERIIEPPEQPPTPPKPMTPPQVSGLYVPALPPCPVGVTGTTNSALDLDDFTPEPGVDCDPRLERSGSVIVRPDGRMIVQP